MQEILINILIFCGILLLLGLTVAVVQGIIILVDIRKGVREIKEKLALFTSLLDIGTILVSGLTGFGKRIKKKGLTSSTNLAAAIAGLKKGLQVLFKDKGGNGDG